MYCYLFFILLYVPVRNDSQIMILASASVAGAFNNFFAQILLYFGLNNTM